MSTAAQAPWEQYASQAEAEHGPWDNYGGDAAPKAPVKTEFEKQRTEGEDRGFASGVGGMDLLKSTGRRLIFGGVDPVSDFGAVRSLADTKKNYQAGASSMRDVLGQTEGAAKKVMPVAAGVASSLAPLVAGYDPVSVRNRAEHADTTGILGETTIPALSAVAPIAHEAIGAATKHFEPALRERAATKGSERVTTALDTPSGKGGAKAAKIDKAVADTRNDLAEIERNAPAKGKGAEAFHDLAEKIEERRKTMWEEGHKPGIERHGEAPINHKQVIAAGRKAISAEAAEAAPEEAAAAEKFLNGIDKDRTLKSADNLVREINDDLKGENAATRYGRLQVRVRQAVVKALRSEIDNSLENLGEKGVRDVNRRWGALGEIQQRLQERAVQLQRSEAKAGPIPDWVHLYTFMHPTGVIPAVGASIKLSSLLKPNAGHTLNRGLRNLNRAGLEAPFTSPPPEGWNSPVKGLLPPPREQLGMPGTAELAHPEMFPQRNPAVAAPRSVQRGASGRMQRVYSGEMPPAVTGQTAEGGLMREAPPATPRAVERPVERRASAPGPFAGVEKRTLPFSSTTGPDPMRLARIKVLKDVVNDPMATARDKAIAKEQLKDMRENPFERNEEKRSISQMKEEKKPRLSRKEAERSSERRKEGRTKRFSKKRGAEND